MCTSFQTNANPTRVTQVVEPTATHATTQSFCDGIVVLHDIPGRWLQRRSCGDRTQLLQSAHGHKRTGQSLTAQLPSTACPEGNSPVKMSGDDPEETRNPTIADHRRLPKWLGPA